MNGPLWQQLIASTSRSPNSLHLHIDLNDFFFLKMADFWGRYGGWIENLLKFLFWGGKLNNWIVGMITSAHHPPAFDFSKNQPPPCVKNCPTKRARAPLWPLLRWIRLNGGPPKLGCGLSGKISQKPQSGWWGVPLKDRRWIDGAHSHVTGTLITHRPTQEMNSP